MNLKMCMVLSLSCIWLLWFPQGSPAHVISQARILEWVAISFSREFSQCRDRTQVSCSAGDLLHCSQILYRLSQQENPEIENKSVEIIQTKHKEKKEWAKMEQSIHSTWEIIKQYNIYVGWIL